MTYVIEIQPASLIRRILSFIIDFMILFPFIVVLYPLWKESLWQGQSIGNKITKIRLINVITGDPPKKKYIFLRNLLFILTLGLGSITIFFSDGRRSFGDLVSKTMVVKNFKSEKGNK